jgi:hypothetical protein
VFKRGAAEACGILGCPLADLGAAGGDLQLPDSAFGWRKHLKNERGHVMSGSELSYYRAIGQCTRSLKNLEACLDKAQKYSAEKKFGVEVLMAERLAPDMGGFIYQIQSACDYVKGAAAWLSGQVPPRHQDNETTIDEVRARIRKTVVYVESLTRPQYAEAASRRVKLSWAPGKIISGEDYLLQVAIPNVYFHIVMAYAILRHNGVDVGKMDFLGPMNFVDAWSD